MRKHGNLLTSAFFVALVLPWTVLADFNEMSNEELEELLRDIEYQEQYGRNDLDNRMDYIHPADESNNDYFGYDYDLVEPASENDFILPSAEIRQPETLQHGTPFDHMQGPPQISKVNPSPPVAPAANNGGSAPARGGPVLPAYCDPPNPCPIGYNEKDGCIEDFENTSDFSRQYQAQQNCLCDSEHMFNCPTEENSQKHDQTFLAGYPPALGKELENDNPYLAGHKLPIAAKKGLGF